MSQSNCELIAHFFDQYSVSPDKTWTHNGNQFNPFNPLYWLEHLKASEREKNWFMMGIEHISRVRRWIVLTDEFIKDSFGLNKVEFIGQYIRPMLRSGELRPEDVYLEPLADKVELGEPDLTIRIQSDTLFSVLMQSSKVIGSECRAYHKHMAMAAICMAFNLKALMKQCTKEQILKGRQSAKEFMGALLTEAAKTRIQTKTEIEDELQKLKLSKNRLKMQLAMHSEEKAEFEALKLLELSEDSEKMEDVLQNARIRRHETMEKIEQYKERLHA